MKHFYAGASVLKLERIQHFKSVIKLTKLFSITLFLVVKWNPQNVLIKIFKHIHVSLSQTQDANGESSGTNIQ